MKLKVIFNEVSLFLILLLLYKQGELCHRNDYGYSRQANYNTFLTDMQFWPENGNVY